MLEDLTEEDDSEYRKINTALLRIDMDYRRPISKKHVKKIIDNFDPNVIRPIKVNYRDGHYYAFDGVHTLKVLKTRNKGFDLDVLCRVWTDKTVEWEAIMFALQDGDVGKLSKDERLKALRAAGEQISESGE